MRVERCISARKYRIQIISAEHFSVIAASLFALVTSFIFTLGTFVSRKKEEEILAFA